MGQKQSTIRYFDGSVYTGEINSAGQEHGDGKIQYANKDILTGRFVDGDCLKAQINYNNGNYYRGQLANLKFNGQGYFKTSEQTLEGLFRQGKFVHGKTCLKNGDTYEGSVIQMKKSGKGILRTKQTTYEGYFQDDLFQGTGMLVSSKQFYEGQFKKGLFDGVGALTITQNQQKVLEYKGQFSKGLFDGEGELKFKNGDIYKGQFSNGQKHGQGRYTYKSGDFYEGRFDNDQKSDNQCNIVFSGKKRHKVDQKGHDKVSNGSKVSSQIPPQASNTQRIENGYYKGSILNGKYHGPGILVQTDGTSYEGQFYQGMKNGKGILKAAEYVYQGYFKNDQKDGEGRIRFNNGCQFIGTFRQNKKQGKGVFIGEKQIITAFYENNLKNGPYEIVDKNNRDLYEQSGQYVNDLKHGLIHVRKGNQRSTLKFDNGNLIEDEQSQF